jgi:hypothetical protein
MQEREEMSRWLITIISMITLVQNKFFTRIV